MRRGTWLLAISGMMALVNGASFAADPSTGTAGRTSLGGTRAGAPERPARARRPRNTRIARKSADSLPLRALRCYNSCACVR